MDYYVYVCAACRTAWCWYGELLCDRAIGADIVRVPASVLRVENNEHPSHYTRERVRANEGRVVEVPR